MNSTFNNPTDPQDPGGREAQGPPGAGSAAVPADALPRLSDAATRVLRRFRVVFNAVKSHFREVEKSAGVGGAQLWALSLIDTHPGLGVNALARAMDIRQTTASNLVRALVAEALVAVDRSTVDRRRVHLRVLPAGLEVLRRAPAPFSGVLPEALAELDAATLQRLEADLGRLVDRLHVDRSAAGVPLAQL